MTIKNIAIIGASGKLGPSVLDALVDAGRFTVTVIARESSKSSFPTAAQTLRIPDDGGNEEQLAAVLQGQDALIVTMPASRVEDTVRLANGCLKAGVRRIIPADFGSVDSSDPRCVELLPILYGSKAKSRDHLQRISEEHTAFSWTSLVCGHFFDWGLSSGLLGFHLKEKTATVFDDGNIRWSSSTLPHIGEAVVKILENEEATRNRMLYMQTFCMSQNELLRVLECVSGMKFKVSTAESEEYIQEKKTEMVNGNHDASEDLVCALGVTRANWEGKLANDMLGLTSVDLRETIGRVWESST